MIYTCEKCHRIFLPGTPSVPCPECPGEVAPRQEWCTPLHLPTVLLAILTILFFFPLSASAEDLLLQGPQIFPVSMVSPGLFNATKVQAESAKHYRYAIYDIAGLMEEGKKVYQISGESATNEKAYPLGIFLGGTGELLQTVGVKSAKAYSHLQVTAPEGAEVLIVHGRLDGDLAVWTTMTESEKRNSYDLQEASEEVGNNGIRLAEPDQAYITFCFDDLRTDQDSICSIFEMFHYPVCLAAIPARFSKIGTGLKEPRGSFFPGMTMLEVAQKVVELGGEVLVHNTKPITEQTNTDFLFMYDSFVLSKQSLQNAGFSPRGFVGAGGEGKVSQTPEIEQWLLGNYDYATNGSSEVYQLKRYDINIYWDELRDFIDEAIENKSWLRICGHDYSTGKGKSFRNEEDLIELLQYCKEKGVHVVTFEYMYDHFAYLES